MKKLLQKITIGIAAILLLAMFGCAAFRDIATPSYIEEDMIVYAEEEPTSFLPWTTLWDAERIEAKFDFMHLMNQIRWQRQIEDDVMFVDFIKNAQAKHTASAKELQKTIFTPDGTIGLLGISSLSMMVGWLGLRRPGDKKE
jgi:hypothetical protein